MSTRNLPVLSPAAVRAQSIQPMIGDEAPAPISFGQIRAILAAYRTLSLLIFVAVLAAALVALLIMPRTYRASATLMVNFDVYDPLGGREFPIALLDSYMATQVDLIQGSQVLLAVVDELDLTQRRPYVSGYDGEPDGLRYWAEARLRRELMIEQGRYGSQLITIHYAASSAAEAAEVANTVGARYAEQQHQRLTGPASERAARYAEQLADLKDKVDLAQQEATAYRRRSGAIDADATGDIGVELLTTLEHRLQETQNMRRLAAARVVGDPRVGAEVLGSMLMQSLKTQQTQQDTQHAELRGSLGARHPQVLALEQQQAVTRNAIRAESRVYGGNAAAELSAVKQVEAELEVAVAAQRKELAAIRQLQDEGAKYQLALASAQSVYQRALEGYDEVLLVSGGAYRNVSVVSAAVPPAKPSGPKKRLVLLIAAVFGFALALAVPLIWELFNRRIRSRDDMERDHGIPVLADLGTIGPRGMAIAHVA
jgi:polysaccharide biosynthesis transport protein